MDTAKPKRKKPKKQFSDYRCDICKKGFADKWLLHSHIKTHSTATPYACDLCPYAGKTAKYLGSHVKKMHTAPTIACDVCGKMFHFKSKMKNHMLVHTGEKPYKCKLCGKTFNALYSLKTHNLIHEDLKPYKCTMCDYACRDSSTLRKHEDRHLGKKVVFPCKICNRLCRTRKDLSLHMDEKHLGLDVNRIPCSVCGKMFRTKTHLTNHVKKVHARHYACKCEICGAVISAKGNLLAHMRSHTDIRPYACTYAECGKRFKSMDYLKKHLVIHYPNRQYPCDICGKLFTRKLRLERHLAQHRPKIKEVQCDLCGVSFYNANYVAAHMRRKHSRESLEYECDECGFRSLNKPGLIMHLKYGHDAENKKVCQVCQKAFKNWNHLRQHYWVAHCINYKKRIRRTKKEMEETVIKQEMESVAEIDLLEIHKEEVVSDVEADNRNVEDKEYPKQVLKEEVVPEDDDDEEHPEKMLGENMMEQIGGNNGKAEVNQTEVLVEIDTSLEENMRRQLESLVSTARKKREIVELEETRREYNERLRRAVEERPKKDRITVKFLRNAKTAKSLDIDSTTVDYSIINDKATDAKGNIINDDSDLTNEKGTDNNDNEINKDGGRKAGKLKLNTHQCYVCFKLFPTKDSLVEHCRSHFDLCGDVMLKKCPLCDYVTSVNLRRHMRLVHRVHIRVPHPRIRDRGDNSNGSRYYYEVEGDLGNVELIPSVSNLNKREYMKIDKRNREERELTVAKTKLVKKGAEWVVERERVSVEDFILPELGQGEVVGAGGGDYLNRMRRLSQLAKSNGAKILFPCEDCPKICQTLSALKLHTRRHDPNAKPFKPKTWKHKVAALGTVKTTKGDTEKGTWKHKVAVLGAIKATKGDTEKGVGWTGKGNGRLGASRTDTEEKGEGIKGDNTEVSKGEEGASAEGKVPNRLANPGPIVNRHRCEPSLREFYAQNVRGGDVEFHQFLKIYNRMSREGLTGEATSGAPIDPETAESPPAALCERNTSVTPVGLRDSSGSPFKRNRRVVASKGSGGQGYKRVVRVSRREHIRRLEMKRKMRSELEAKSS